MYSFLIQRFTNKIISKVKYKFKTYVTFILKGYLLTTVQSVIKIEKIFPKVDFWPSSKPIWWSQSLVFLKSSNSDYSAAMKTIYFPPRVQENCPHLSLFCEKIMFLTSLLIFIANLQKNEKVKNLWALLGLIGSGLIKSFFTPSTSVLNLQWVSFNTITRVEPVFCVVPKGQEMETNNPREECFHVATDSSIRLLFSFSGWRWFLVFSNVWPACSSFDWLVVGFFFSSRA